MKIKLGFNVKYFGEEISDFLSKSREIFKKARVHTESERFSQLIQYSLENDFKEGFRKRDHGQDAKTITEERLAWISEKIANERKKQELAMLQEFSEILSEIQRKTDSRISDLSGALGVGGGERLREINEAKARRAQKSAV